MASSSPGLGDDSPLERELQAMMRRGAQQRRPTPRAYIPAKVEAPKVEKNGIRLNSDGTITIQGTTYSRAEFRAALEANMQAQRADPKSAFSDRRHPDHAAAVSDMQLGYKFLGGELTESDEKEIVTEWHEATQESSEVANPQPYQQIAEMCKDPEVRAAKQRRDAGARLDDREKEIMRQYDQLEAANNSIAYRERGLSGEPRKNLSTYVPGDVMPFATNQNKVQRLQQAAEHRVKVMNNPKHPYWDAGHGEHAAAVLGMKIAQEMLQNGGDSFVQINPDGSIGDEE